MIHELKTWKPYFDAVLEGIKTFEVRKADRAFAVGDILRLREYYPVGCTYSGREIDVRVIYELSAGPFAIPGFVVMAIEKLPPAQEHPDTETRAEMLDRVADEDSEALMPGGFNE